jgi:hypothetical protein
MNSTDPLSKRLSYACFTELPLTMKTVLNSNLGQSHFGWLCLTMYANKNLRENIILCAGVFIFLSYLESLLSWNSCFEKSCWEQVPDFLRGRE